MKTPFNKPYFTGKEPFYVAQCAYSGELSGNGMYTQKCHEFFELRYGFKKALLTSSCSDALEMAALLGEVEPGDQVIMPSYTFVSTANAFALRGAEIVFADIGKEIPNIDPDKLEGLITEKTKALVVVHYAGLAVDMDRIMEIAERHNLFVVEDAAHAIDSYYKDRPLGSIGHVGTFSFHETKNIIAGEGGLLTINDESLIERAEILWEKGTNRAAFSRGEVEKYEWVDLGSSYLPPDMIAAFLYAQLQHLDEIQEKRLHIWEKYNEELAATKDKGLIYYPDIPSYATQNGNMFYFLAKTEKERSKILEYLKQNGILAVFHYLPLHESKYYIDKHDGRDLPNTREYSSRIVRLPFYAELADSEIEVISDRVRSIV
ncbi:MAG: dTDP-4-amino-4,6-dideoxygalactose transaminase [Bacteroidales bacterium]|nr:dTDP-4-amino-4,6-dideoxygalactose transaminase [Bacteroidales bacterium]MCF8338480.1 dTDP-4-amino-4,6-dideoxygalactose transaminase [Bacteroidales bacterium]